MNILMISDVYFPRVNGVSTSIESFRQALARHGHSVTLICPAYPVGHEDDPDILRIPSRGVLADPEDRMMHYRRVTELTPTLAKKCFDLIHVHTPFVAHYAGVTLAQRMGLPIVETCHTLFEEYLHHYITWLPKRLLRWAAQRVAVRQCRAVDALVAPSSPMRATLERHGVRCPITVIATGLPLESFCQAVDGDFRQRYRLPPEAPLLLFVGRAAHEKNIAFLIDMLPRVLARHPSALLVIAGEGPAQEALVHRAQQAGVEASVRFVGYVRRDGPLQSMYRAADVFVFASRTETQGLVLLESMALGTPVVSTAVMGTLDVLRDDVGCLIAEDDANDFASKVNRLLDDTSLKSRLSQRAVDYAGQWHEDAKARQLAGWYRQVCEREIHGHAPRDDQPDR
ncbi:glycosyltransferase [Litchfieldella rifensis]|uniref:Glycosyltransferase n=1 Tax=Litchfieldella rifensis TaxID=762643 RepID=A0ABV7LJS2_9GAMM